MPSIHVVRHREPGDTEDMLYIQEHFVDTILPECFTHYQPLGLYGWSLKKNIPIVDQKVFPNDCIIYIDTQGKQYRVSYDAKCFIYHEKIPAPILRGRDLGKEQ
jgi:hypothetical protein